MIKIIKNAKMKQNLIEIFHNKKYQLHYKIKF